MPITIKNREGNIVLSFPDDNLSHAYLRGTSLQEADFHGLDLSFADFSRSNLSFADFSGANLQGANLSKCVCHCSNFTRANLQGAIFSNHSNPPLNQLSPQEFYTLKALSQAYKIHLTPQSTQSPSRFERLHSL
jgi:hypothetical protein